MKYIKEKPAKTEPRIFEVAKRMPKSMARNGLLSANLRLDEISTRNANDDSKSDPVQQAYDTSTNGVLFAENKTAKQISNAIKTGHRQLQKSHQANVATNSAQTSQSAPLRAACDSSHVHGRVIHVSYRSGIRPLKTTRLAAKTSKASINAAKFGIKTANHGTQIIKRSGLEIIRNAVRVCKIFGKAILISAKATALTIKGLSVMIAAGGGVAVVIIVIIVIWWFLTSQFSIVFTRNDSQSSTVQTIVDELTLENHCIID